MSKFDKVKYDEMAKIIKSMAHPTRLFIVDELSKQDHCVCELTEMIGADTSTVSKHLTVLKNTGIVQDRKEGNNVYYSLRCSCVLSFYQCVRDVISHNVEDQLKLLK